MNALTDRQQMTLAFVRERILDGLPPTLREIGRFMGIRSTNGVTDHLLALERKGYIRLERGRIRRGIVLVDRCLPQYGRGQPTHTIEWMVPEKDRP